MIAALTNSHSALRRDWSFGFAAGTVPHGSLLGDPLPMHHARGPLHLLRQAAMAQAMLVSDPQPAPSAAGGMDPPGNLAIPPSHELPVGGMGAFADHELLNSPGKLRRFSNNAMVVDTSPSVPVLPSLADVCAESLLLWHVHQTVNREGPPTSKRRRLRGKCAPLVSEVGPCIADRSLSVHEHKFKATDRQRVSQVAARVMGAAFRLTVREARTRFASLWKAASVETRTHWCHFARCADYPQPLASGPVSPLKVKDEIAIEAYGALFTWQTAIGRGQDSVRNWLDLNIEGETLFDLMQGDKELQYAFSTFSQWVESQCACQDFSIWATAMEANTSPDARAAVHLHAFVCADWKLRHTPQWVKGDATSSQWQWQGYNPFVRVTAVRGNADAKKVLVQGLFYCQARKVGSLFSAGNVAAGKDFAAYCCTPMS